MRKSLLLIYCIMLVVVAGCSMRHSSERLADKTIQGDIFAKALARHYQQFSNKEAEGHDWDSAKYFGDKGLRAERGIEVDPEHPEDWEIPETLMPGLLEARRSLLDVISGNVLNQQPKRAARAYYLFDCWVEELEEWQESNSAYCRDELFLTLDEIQNPPKVEVSKTTASKAESTKNAVQTKDSSVKAPEYISPEVTLQKSKEFSSAESQFVEGQKATFEDVKKTVPVATQNIQSVEKSNNSTPVQKIILKKRQYYVFFENQDTKMTADGSEVVKEIVNALEGKNGYEITVLGYMGIAENPDENEELADKRAESVNNALVKNGIAASSIEFYGFSDPAGDIDENEKSAKTNRRVEIYIK